MNTSNSLLKSGTSSITKCANFGCTKESSLSLKNEILKTTSLIL